eukprot:163875-Chlamydomonas_euryale.AAC.2
MRFDSAHRRRLMRRVKEKKGRRCGFESRERVEREDTQNGERQDLAREPPPSEWITPGHPAEPAGSSPAGAKTTTALLLFATLAANKLRCSTCEKDWRQDLPPSPPSGSAALLCQTRVVQRQGHWQVGGQMERVIARGLKLRRRHTHVKGAANGPKWTANHPSNFQVPAGSPKSLPLGAYESPR